MAGEVCVRCLWSGPATSAPGGLCPVCGSPLGAAPAAAGKIGATSSRDADRASSATNALDATDDPFAASAPAPGNFGAGDDGSLDDGSLDDGSLDDGSNASVGGGAPPISRGRWALLVMNLALLLLCVALAVSTALGWRVGVAGALNSSPANTPIATTSATTDGAPTIATGALLSPTPTVTTTPTAAVGGAPPTPRAQPTAPVRPTATPHPTIYPGN